MKTQQGIFYQLDLFTEEKLEGIRSSEERKDVNGSQARKESQVNGVIIQGRALAGGMMAQICSHGNIRQAYRRVKQNDGPAGIDGMSVQDFSLWFKDHGDKLIIDLLEGNYSPSPVRRVEIEKLSGGVRKLGIPTVTTDRVIQQSIAQVLSPIYDSHFSAFSYGFRPKRNAHQALCQAIEFVSMGKKWVVSNPIEG